MFGVHLTGLCESTHQRYTELRYCKKIQCGKNETLEEQRSMNEIVKGNGKYPMYIE